MVMLRKAVCPKCGAETQQYASLGLWRWAWHRIAGDRFKTCLNSIMLVQEN